MCQIMDGQNLGSNSSLTCPNLVRRAKMRAKFQHVSILGIRGGITKTTLPTAVAFAYRLLPSPSACRLYTGMRRRHAIAHTNVGKY